MPARRPPTRIGSTDVARPEDVPAKALADAMPPGLGLSEILRETRNNPGKLMQLADEVRGHVRYGPPTPDDVDRARRTIDDALRRRELVAFGRHSLRRRGPINYPPELADLRAPPPSIPSDKDTSWFEALVVDAAQRPIAGLQVALDGAGEHRSGVTNGNGQVRFEHLAASVGSLRIVNAKSAKDALAERPPSAPVPPPEEADAVRLILGHDDLVAVLHAEAPRTIILVEPLPRVRLIGMHFDTNKAFLRPSALRGIGVVSSVCDENPTETLLVVGHTDTTGEEKYNLDLSLERAQAVVANLRKDTAAWEAWFDDSRPYQKRWGDHEIALMISALPCVQTVAGFQAWSNDARGTALEIDGVAGPLTRHALIAAYMDVEGEGVSEDTEVEVHGCGEYFPAETTGDGVASEENRRVEVFCFEGPVKPPRPGDEATPGEPEYPQWRDSVTETIDVTAEPMADVALRLLDRDYSPMAAAACRATWGTKEHARGTSDGNGIVDLMIPETVESFVVEWGEPQDRNAVEFMYRRVVQRPKDENEPALLQRLVNIGIRRAEDDTKTSVQKYQRVRKQDETGIMDDIRNELLAWHDDAVDPSRVPKGSG